MIRKAVINDLAGIMICINDAKVFLKNSGSIQWNGPDNYPNEEILENDIKNGICYVYDNGCDICGVSVFAGLEKEYDNLVKGKWLTNTNNYLTVHRVAVSNKYRGTGICKALLSYALIVAEELNKDSVRIDTHPKNLIMQNACSSLGFTDCGIVIYNRIEVEPERIVYEKIVKTH